MIFTPRACLYVYICQCICECLMLPLWRKKTLMTIANAKFEKHRKRERTVGSVGTALVPLLVLHYSAKTARSCYD